MMVVDTSALMAIVLAESEAEQCIAALEAEPQVLISAVSVAEALIVAARRNVSEEMSTLLDRLGFEIVPVTESTARRVAQSYGRWGKGVHPAGLNLGDCFAYEVASTHGCPLLYIGGDFSKTDLTSVL